jgi:SPX domain protein involved in polyphosphate accumulation
MIIDTFRRREEKYLLNNQQYNSLLQMINDYIEKDKFFISQTCNIYFDTDHFDLIKESIEKPIYKEKVRLRSYYIPTEEDKVFFEIKKKYNGITSKRRITISLKDFNDYYIKHKMPECNQQILSEINYIMDSKKLKPKLFLAYDRNSYYAKDNQDLRITFDKNLRFRTTDLDLNLGDAGIKYFKEDMYILEIKTLDAIPLWLTNALSNLEIYPVSFSKYGSIYKDYILKEETC